MHLELWNPEETTLDLLAVPLFGWEPFQSRRKIKNFAQAIKNGATFPAVAVEFVSDEGYFLVPRVSDSDGRVDGGHHRAVAHFVAGMPLPVRVQEIAEPPQRGVWLPVEQLVPRRPVGVH